MNAAYVRIFLRYVIGAVFMGSSVLGDQLAADPDVVMALSGLSALAVEGFYIVAKKLDWKL